MRFNRPCLDCGTLTDLGNRCASCATKARNKWSAAKGASPYHNRAWQRLSAKARQERPWCELCGATQDLTADHITPLSKGGALIVPTSALRVLCRRCHGKITKHTP